MSFPPPPPSSRATLGRNKLLLHRSYRGRVPDPILDSPKRGFGVPLGAWFRGDLQGHARDSPATAPPSIAATPNESAVRGVLDGQAAEQGNRSLQLWSLVMLELWQGDLGRQSGPAMQGSTRICLS
jgi:asparagine synthase (glutamine-hydrolysing)